uniref:Uncharacterized protein n=1 Tax=Anguilla anguilla TaxID=7936 RepID=A0A0E9TUB4_ANGAN
MNLTVTNRGKMLHKQTKNMEEI